MENSFRPIRILLNPRLWIYGCLTILLVISLGLCVLQTKQGNATILWGIETVADDVFPELDLSIQTLETDVFTEFKLGQVTMSVSDSEPSISVHALNLNYDLWKIVSGETLAFLVIEQTTVYIEQLDDGMLNVSKMFDTGEQQEQVQQPTQWPSLPVDLLVPIIEVSNARIEYEDLAADISVDASLDWKDGDQIRFGLEDVDVSIDEVGQLLTQLEVGGNGERVDISALVEYKGATVSLQGSIEDLVGDLYLDVKGKAFCPQDYAMNWSDQLIPSQDVTLEYQLTWDSKDVRLDGSIEDSAKLKGLLNPMTEEWMLELELDELSVHEYVPVPTAE